MTAATIRVALAAKLGVFDLDVTFDAPARGVIALFGPSGCGKTTVLRCIAGLHRAAGHVEIGDDVWQDARSFRPAHERPIGYVFQEASLFPHLSVRRNLLFGAPQVTSTSGEAIVSFNDVVDLLNIRALLDRAPRNLSGGERQRVAIGRALLSQPAILLMDEPLSALDRQTKDEVLPFLERLHDALAIPVVYVSHDMSEVERLADHLVLIRDGRVIGSGPLQALQSDPSLPLAFERQAAVTLDGRVAGYDSAHGLLRIDVPGNLLIIPSAPAPNGERRRVRVAASDVSLSIGAASDSSILNRLPARIVSVTAASDFEMLVVVALGEDDGGAKVLSRVTRKSWDSLRLRRGALVTAQIKSVALMA